MFGLQVPEAQLSGSPLPASSMLLRRLRCLLRSQTWLRGARLGGGGGGGSDGAWLPATAAAAAGRARRGSSASPSTATPAPMAQEAAADEAAPAVDLQKHVPSGAQWAPDVLPERWLAFSDLHVSLRTRSVCLQVLERVHEEAAARGAGILFLGDFWHTRGALPVEPLNEVVEELAGWAQPTLMLPGNHDQVSLGGLSHALTPLAAANPAIHAFDGPALFMDALWLPYRRKRQELEAALAAAAGGAGAGDGSALRAVFAHTDIIGAMMNEAYQAHDGLPPDLFPSDLPTYTGHYHKPHTVAGSRITYLGSPYQVTRAEAGQQKRLLLLDRSAGWEVAEELPLSLGPRYFSAAAVSTAPAPAEASADLAAAAAESAEASASEAGAAPEPAFELALPEGLRSGDRLLLTLPEGAAKQHKSTLRKLEKQGVEVEIFTPPTASAAPRIAAAEGEGPLQLWERYCAYQRLPEGAGRAGAELLRRVLQAGAGQAGALEQPLTSLQFEAVELEGYFSFKEAVRYDLAGRGLVVVTGQVQDQAATGMESNGAGKTALVMAPLWALTGNVDPRAEGTGGGRGVSLAGLVNEGAKRARVRVEGRVNGLPFAVERTANRKASSVTFHLNGEEQTTQENRLTQKRIDATLGADLLGRVAFYGQSDITALLEAPDRVFKEELAKLVDLQVWTAAKEESRCQLSSRKDALSDAAVTRRERQQQAAALQGQLEQLQAEAAQWEQQQAAGAEGLRREAAELLGRLRGQQAAVAAAAALGRHAVAALEPELADLQRQLQEAEQPGSGGTGSKTSAGKKNGAGSGADAELAAAEQRLADLERQQREVQARQQRLQRDLGAASAEGEEAARQQAAAAEQAERAAADLQAFLGRHPQLAAANRSSSEAEEQLDELLWQQKQQRQEQQAAEKRLTAARVEAARQQSRQQDKSEAAQQAEQAAAEAAAAAGQMQSELAALGGDATSLADAQKQQRAARRRLLAAQQRLGAAQGQAEERQRQLEEYLAVNSSSSGSSPGAHDHVHADAAEAAVCDRCLQPISGELFQQNVARLQAAASAAAAKAAKAEDKLAEVEAAVAACEAGVAAAEQWEARAAVVQAAQQAAATRAAEAKAAGAAASKAVELSAKLEAAVAAAEAAVAQQEAAAQQLEAALEAAEEQAALEEQRQQLLKEAAGATAAQGAAAQRIEEARVRREAAAAELETLEAAAAEAVAALAATQQELRVLAQRQQALALLRSQERQVLERQRRLQAQLSGLEELAAGQLAAAQQELQQVCGSADDVQQPASSSSDSDSGSGSVAGTGAEAEAALEAVASAARAAVVSAADLQQRWRWQAQQPNLSARDAALVEQQLGVVREAEAEVEARHAALEGEVAIWKQVDDAFLPKGVMNFVLESVLGELQAATSRNLSALTSGMALTLSPCKPASKAKGGEEGATIETIEKIVHVRQHGSLDMVQRHVKQLSGGERRRVALALALGFSELAAQRGRLRSNLIVLDEAFQHLDGEGCQRVAQLLKQLPGYDSVLVVAQAHSLWTQLFDATDVVVKADGRSRVEQGSSAEVS